MVCCIAIDEVKRDVSDEDYTIAMISILVQHMLKNS